MPAVGNQKANVGKTPVDIHIETIRAYIWDEGPQTSATLARLIGLAESRTLEILTLAKHSGEMDSFRRGEEIYWLRGEDAESPVEA